MISRRIARKPENDKYRRLANYIADVGRKGEKCLLTWCAGCWAGDDYDLAIQEVADTQALNTRTTREKTYHLIVSFRPEDEAKLTSAVLKEIEIELAKALGFEEHQRHCGVHKNTANLHMHVAYSMIHPEKLTRHEPFRDYHTRDRVCRELEQRFGLTTDKGRDQERSQDRQRLGDKAATTEVHSGQQSFEGYAKGHRESILANLEQVADWHSFHHALAFYGLAIKPYGNGLIFKDRHGRHTIKASSLDRSLAKGSLEKRLGPFQPPSVAVVTMPSQERYRAKPLHHSPERGNLFVEYQAGIARRKAALAVSKDQLRIQRDMISQVWERKRHEIAHMALTKPDRIALLKLTREHEAQARRRTAHEVATLKNEVTKAIPYTSWSTFLRWQATEGNETALAILRSREHVVESEHGDLSDISMKTNKIVDWELWQNRRRTILNNQKLKSPEKHALLSVALMRYFEAQEATPLSGYKSQILQGFTYNIDAKGSILFTFANGDLIRDMGDQIYFSIHVPAIRNVVLKLARAKWGADARLEGTRARILKPGVDYGQSPPVEIIR